MSHLNSNERASEANYMTVEVNNLSEQPTSTEFHSGPLRTAVKFIQHQWKENGIIKLITVALAIIISFFIVGILAERMMRIPYYNQNGTSEKFKFEMTLIGVQFLCSYIFIKGIYCFYIELS